MKFSGQITGVATNWSCHWEVKQLTCSCKFRLLWPPLVQLHELPHRLKAAAHTEMAITFLWKFPKLHGSKAGIEKAYCWSAFVLSLSFWVTHPITMFKGKLTNLHMPIIHKRDSWDSSFREEHWLVGHKLDESSGRGGLTLSADIKVICKMEEFNCLKVEA